METISEDKRELVFPAILRRPDPPLDDTPLTTVRQRPFFRALSNTRRAFSLALDEVFEQDARAVRGMTRPYHALPILPISVMSRMALELL